MSFDFMAFLVLATLITGSVWLADVLVSARRQPEANTASATPRRMPSRRGSRSAEYARALFPVLLLVLGVRAFVVEPFTIPSNSMLPTLYTGDFILVNKFAYGLRLPIADTTLIPLGVPRRGDVAVFAFPQDPSIDYIKRIVALPDDLVDYRDKTLYINGTPQPQRPVARFVGMGAAGEMSGAELVSENLDERSHQILVRTQAPNLKPGCNILAAGPIRVPETHYFVLGDNRDGSNDSRCFGFVPDSHLRGKAFFVWMHWDATRPTELPIAFERIGQVVR